LRKTGFVPEPTVACLDCGLPEVPLQKDVRLVAWKSLLEFSARGFGAAEHFADEAVNFEHLESSSAIQRINKQDMSKS
jgi:hypothetical protein